IPPHRKADPALRFFSGQPHLIHYPELSTTPAQIAGLRAMEHASPAMFNCVVDIPAMFLSAAPLRSASARTSAATQTLMQPSGIPLQALADPDRRGDSAASDRQSGNVPAASAAQTHFGGGSSVVI